MSEAELLYKIVLAPVIFSLVVSLVWALVSEVVLLFDIALAPVDGVAWRDPLTIHLNVQGMALPAFNHALCLLVQVFARRLVATVFHGPTPFTLWIATLAMLG